MEHLKLLRVAHGFLRSYASDRPEYAHTLSAGLVDALTGRILLGDDRKARDELIRIVQVGLACAPARPAAAAAARCSCCSRRARF